MRLLGREEPTDAVEAINWLAEPEGLGDVEVKNRCMSRGACCRIEMGRWEIAKVYVWGHGTTIDEACREAVEKARPLSRTFPHPRGSA